MSVSRWKISRELISKKDKMLLVLNDYKSTKDRIVQADIKRRCTLKSWNYIKSVHK